MDIYNPHHHQQVETHRKRLRFQALLRYRPHVLPHVLISIIHAYTKIYPSFRFFVVFYLTCIFYID